MTLTGAELPHITSPVPGPGSRALARRLALRESPNITCQTPQPPIFWESARGANVRDVDGNVYVDLTAGFGVAHAGHSNSAVAAAIGAQARQLAHGLGDVFPAEAKVRLLERLAEIAPGALEVSILASSGAEAVEAALKTAAIRTARTGVLSFRGAYHGLTYGALAATHGREFRAPFEPQLFPGVMFAPYPETAAQLTAALAEVEARMAAAESTAWPVGAILVEPIQGRGGLIDPPPGFLPALRRLCDGDRVLLVCDEVYTGCGRTGRWFACEHTAVVPDLLVLGKALSGSLPISAVIGTPDAMSGWPPSTGEAIHTSTFLGNPIACAAALAQLDEIESRGLVGRAASLGELIASTAAGWCRQGLALRSRGRGLLQGVVLASAAAGRAVTATALEAGVIVLTEGAGDVLAVTPPAVITDAQLVYALRVIESALSSNAASSGAG